MSLRRLSSVIPPTGAYTPIGARKDWITIYNQPDRDPATGKTLDPTSFTQTWAKIRALSGQEAYRAQQISQNVDQLVIIEYLDGVHESMTIGTEDGRTFQIRFVQDPPNTGVELYLYCEEVGQNAGQS